MRTLGLLLLVCAACGKKPAAKTPTPPPPAEQKDEDKDKAGEPKPAKPAPTNTPRIGDPCDGGEKPH
ncbi:MAG TPA: hypothetical protein VK601_21565 [Kofleriaceae bacterium]|nr:hypothetical protein [Kofleriaceae bacterium]